MFEYFTSEWRYKRKQRIAKQIVLLRRWSIRVYKQAEADSSSRHGLLNVTSFHRCNQTSPRTVAQEAKTPFWIIMIMKGATKPVSLIFSKPSWSVLFLTIFIAFYKRPAFNIEPGHFLTSVLFSYALYFFLLKMDHFTEKWDLPERASDQD